MWINNKNNGEWINLEHVMRLSKDGQGGYIAAMADGRKCQVTQEEFEDALQFLNRPKDEKPKFDLQKEIEAIKEALKMKPKEGE